MNYVLRTLDPAKDEAMFKLAYDWIFTRPDWFQYMDGVASIVSDTYSFDNYLKAAKKPTEVNVGLFNGKLRAVYTIQDQKNGSFQVHVGAEQGVDQLALVAGAICLKEWLFANGAREVFGWLASVNRPMAGFAAEAGFSYCGVSVFKGSLNDRPIRWLRYQAVR
jgi:hypothetical protein